MTAQSPPAATASPVFVAACAEPWRVATDERLKGNFEDLTACVRKGGTVLEDEGTMSVENPLWLEFARYMGKLQANPAEQIAH
ncbi:MAG: hypothetical protein ACXVZR_12090, partial [Terriglobales bacterium]